MTDIRTLTDEELVKVLAAGQIVDIPEDCGLKELIAIHSRLNAAAEEIRKQGLADVRNKLKELDAWRDEHLPKQEVLFENGNICVSIIKK
jgi:hypothetical protein